MKVFKSFFLCVVACLLFGAVNASAADKAPLTPEFCEEGISKAVEVFNNMADEINRIETVEQVEELQTILDSIKMRNVRKKYGKIVLTDEYRQRLLEPNLRIGQALKDMVVRVQLPYQLQQALETYITPETLKKSLAESKTLRDAMQ